MFIAKAPGGSQRTGSSISDEIETITLVDQGPWQSRAQKTPEGSHQFIVKYET